VPAICTSTVDRSQDRGTTPRSDRPGTRAALFAELTVSENIFRAGAAQRPGIVGRRDPGSSSCWTARVPARDATVRSGTCPSPSSNRCPCAKALAGDAKLLILDEPSAILTDSEIDVLFGVIRG